MKTTLIAKRKLFLLSILLSAGIVSNAQLKIGDNPTTVQKSSILELESSRQGLLLPRLSDTAAINALTPPDGMIIYLSSDHSLRLRSNGSWKKIADFASASANWSLTGNSGTDSSINYIGTADGRPLIMKTAGSERMRIDAFGNIGIGTNTPTAKLNVNGTVKLENLAADSSTLTVLVLAANGSVYKRNIASSAFQTAITAINGIQKQTLSFAIASSTTKDSVTIENRSADSTIAVYLPVQNGSSGANKPYGFLTYSDWQKIQTAVQTITIGAVAASADVNGATIDTSGTSRTIILHPADATHPGIVTSGTQTFGGNKTFDGNVAANGTLTLNNLANNGSSDSVLVVHNNVIQKRLVSAATFGNAIHVINGNRDTSQVIGFWNFGSDVSVTTNGKDSIHLNLPDAGTSARGLITTAAQTFAGNKTFQDSVAAPKAILVGNTGSANSTMQIAGSLAMSIKIITANYTITSADNTILANTTGGAITMGLPAPGNIGGRIYTIKKIGTGGIDNQLTITASSGTIDGGSSYTIYNDWTYVTMQTDGANWYIIKK